VIITKNGFDALIEKMQRQIAKVKWLHWGL
jgi:hypothetical protein